MKRISKFMVVVLMLGLLFAFMTATASASEMGWADSAEDLQAKINEMADGAEIEIYCEGTVNIDKTVTFNKSGRINIKGNPTFVSGVTGAYLFEVQAKDVTVDFGGSTIQLADPNTWREDVVNGAAVHLAGEHDKLYNANFYFGADLKTYEDDIGRESIDFTGSNMKKFTFFGGSETGVVTVDGDKCYVENCTFGAYYNADEEFNGTITINADTCVVDRCTIEGADSWAGSAVYVTEGHSWNTIKNSTFSYCYCQTHGNVYLNGKCNTVMNCQFNHCTGGRYSGGIFVGKESCDILNNKFLDCRSEQRYYNNSSIEGGAVYVDAVNCLISECDFTKCMAYDNAGAIFIYKNGCSIDSCTFTDCYASDYGGAAYAARGVYDIYFTNCTFTGCDSYYKDGTIYSQGSTAYNVFFRGCTFDTEEDFDTALYVWEDYTSIKNCNKFNNDVSISAVEYSERGPSANTGSVLSTGNIVVVCVVAAAAVAGVAAAVMVSKKKKAVAKN